MNRKFHSAHLLRRTRLQSSDHHLLKATSKAETKELKMHIRFSQMYIAAQVRGADLNEFFSHETLPYPPALSKSGDMQSGNKSLLLSCIKPLENVPTIPQVDGAVLEGSMIANTTKPKKNQNLSELLL